MNSKLKTYSVAKALKHRRKNLKLGFTLVELLVVMAILGILTVITLGNFRTSQIKARDAQRKSDLRQIANALEAYFNDRAGYPEASGGKIKACGCGNGELTCDWDTETNNREFCDKNNTVYMSKVPGDPLSDPEHGYCYESDESYYRIYAILENSNDPEAKLDVTCVSRDYNFGVSSPNVPLVEEEEE
jgi:prepilin-type N-terminal cleavage/methylation domain-containing protein